MGKNKIITPEVETVHNRSESDTMPEIGPLFTAPNSPFSPLKTDGKQVALKGPVQLLIREKKYKTADQLRAAMETYFNDADLTSDPYTIEGLALACGFTSIQTLANYGGAEGYEEFWDVVKMAKLRVQGQRVSLAVKGKLHPTTFIFLLANNHQGDYKRDVDSKENGAYKVESFIGGYEAPAELKEQNDGKDNTDDLAADRKAG